MWQCVYTCVCVCICDILITKIVKWAFLQGGTVLAGPHKVRVGL